MVDFNLRHFDSHLFFPYGHFCKKFWYFFIVVKGKYTSTDVSPPYSRICNLYKFIYMLIWSINFIMNKLETFYNEDPKSIVLLEHISKIFWVKFACEGYQRSVAVAAELLIILNFLVAIKGYCLKIIPYLLNNITLNWNRPNKKFNC